MKALKVTAEPRDSKGSGPVGRLRREGFVPGVVYGEGKPAKLVQLKLHDFEQALRGHSGEHMLLDLDVKGDQALKVLLKEVQHHPVSGQIIHADFHEISLTKKLRLEVPIRLVGEPAGVSQQGGVLEHVLREVEIECLPTDIPEQVNVDVSGLNIGDSLTVADIRSVAVTFTVLSDPGLAIAAVSAPRVEEEAAPVAAAVEGAAEPEVIREKKDEAEEGEESAEGKKESKAESRKEGKEKG